MLRVQYGKVNNVFFGSLTLPKFPASRTRRRLPGHRIYLQGRRHPAEDSFFIMKTKDGIAYRSKNLNTLYQDTNWRDIVLKASDLCLRPAVFEGSPRGCLAAGESRLVIHCAI